MRYSEIVFLAPLLLLGGRQAIVPLLASFAAGVLLFTGAYDWLSWGRPFASLIEFARYTLVARESSSVMREQPAWWYLAALPQWLAPPLLPLLWREWRRALVWIAIPLLVLSLIHHKELRYLQAAIPFAMILAAQGAMQWWDEGRRKLVIALLILALPLQLARIRSVEKRSMAAVDAARTMQTTHVAVSQQWAYGGKVLLRNGEELGSPPDPERLRAAAPGVDCAALYRSEITPGMRTILANAGLTSSRTFEHGRSRVVEVFCRD